MNTHLQCAKLDAIRICVAASPLFGLTVVLVAYLIALRIYAREAQSDC
ncbi:hypothetical protein [Paraburkholderia piptadeniae]|nr:hypothetical protein [Paraburkholderia piptadeniae]